MPKRLSDMTEPELREGLFVLVAFDDPGLAQYISNCDRDNMVRSLRECADRLEAREDVTR